ncbi:MAG TPA: adenylate kinase family protein [Candidatus Bathyarchaeia archaeon]|nr:adenylate kinase family protein [Candidatus Bathyarchaeia archaeon]
MANIILVTGTPGVGKSRLAERLSRSQGYTLIELSELAKSEKLYDEFDRARDTYIVNEPRLRRRIASFSHSEKIVLSTHLVGKFLPTKMVKLALVLRLDPLVLYRRLRRRGWTKWKAWENTEAEILGVSIFESISLLGRRRVYEIDTTRKSAERVYREAVRALSRPRTNKPGLVDWLALYDPIEMEKKL